MNVVDRNALVLSGGGARAAYQVGCLRQIAREIPEYRPKIITGVSAGAINAVYLASFQGQWSNAVDSLMETWLQLETRKVYHTDLGRILQRIFFVDIKSTKIYFHLLYCFRNTPSEMVRDQTW